MFTLQRVNVVRKVLSEEERDRLVSEGFEEIEEEKLDLNSLSVKELKDLAKYKKIEGYGDMKKEDLIAALEGGE